LLQEKPNGMILTIFSSIAIICSEYPPKMQIGGFILSIILLVFLGKRK
jgi:hypothetical protein